MSPLILAHAHTHPGTASEAGEVPRDEEDEAPAPGLLPGPGDGSGDLYCLPQTWKFHVNPDPGAQSMANMEKFLPGKNFSRTREPRGRGWKSGWDCTVKKRVLIRSTFPCVFLCVSRSRITMTGAYNSFGTKRASELP